MRDQATMSPKRSAPDGNARGETLSGISGNTTPAYNHTLTMPMEIDCLEIFDSMILSRMQCAGLLRYAIPFFCHISTKYVTM